MPSYLITGSARGLGLEIAKRLAIEADTTIFTSDIHPTLSPTLESLIASSGGRVHYVQLDITNVDNVNRALDSVKQTLNEHGRKGLDVLINNAGIQFIEPEGPTSMPNLLNTFTVNVLGTHTITSAFIPLLSSGSTKKIVNISSTLGSITFQNRGLWTDIPLASYKISKAALNQMTVLYANQLKDQGFTVFAISPGWMQTDIVGGGPDADLKPEQSANVVVDIIAGATQEKDNGVFRNVKIHGFERYDGLNVPW